MIFRHLLNLASDSAGRRFTNRLLHCSSSSIDVLAKTGRQIMLDYLRYEIARATTADLQRAAEFLEGARQIRAGCRKQRSESRKSQAQGWRKHVDDSITW